MAEYSYTQQSIWNIDDERLKQLNYYMVLCEECFVDWDLEGIYTYLHAIKRVASAKLQKYPKDWGEKNSKKDREDKTEKDTDKKNDDEEIKKTVMEMMEEMEESRRKMNHSQKDDFEKNRISFYNKAVEVYEFISAKLQQHGFFFREGLDPSKAALRR